MVIRELIKAALQGQKAQRAGKQAWAEGLNWNHKARQGGCVSSVEDLLTQIQSSTGSVDCRSSLSISNQQ